MKRLISLFLLTLGIILPILAQQKEIDVYLVGGQSNATGQAYVKNIPASFKILSSTYKCNFLGADNKQ
ncbi:hypothetical protein [Phocaeicola dorei]|uniref:hypothetical protein n=1 Tax=Phocaeicola dorei TaxID=357276 RepID=UPI0039B3C5AF